MAIQSIPSINLNNSTTPFGGRIYSFSYNIGFGSEVSNMKMSIISPNGQYTISDSNLSYESVVKVTFGNKTINMLLVAYNIEKSDKGNMLQIELDDTSPQYLDRLSILLNGQYYNNRSFSPYVIGLGDSYNFLNVQGYNGIPETVYYIETPTLYNIIKVPKVYYTPRELLIGIASRIPCDVSVSNILNSPTFQYYRINYMGTVRDVLTRVGQDLAFNFYWNENDQLQFVDLTSSVKISPPPITGQVRTSQSSNLRGTFTYGTASFYGVDGYQQQSFIGDISFSFKYQVPQITNYGFSDSINPNDANFQRLVKAARLGQELFSFFFLSMASTDSLVANYYGINVQFVNQGNNKAVYNELLQQLNTTDSSLSAFQIDSSFLPVVANAYEQFRAYGDAIEGIFIAPMAQAYYAGYTWDTTFDWYNQNILVSQTSLARFYPQNISDNPNLTLKQLLNPANTDTIPPPPNTPSSIVSIYGFGIIFKGQSWNTQVDFTSLQNVSPPSATINGGNAAVLGGNTYFCYFNNDNNNSIYSDLINSIKTPTPLDTITIQGHKTNALPNTYIVPRVLDTQFTDAIHADVNRFNFVPLEISQELLGLIIGTGPAILSVPQAHALLSQPYIGYGQILPFKTQTYTVVGTNIPNITIQQGLEKLEMTSTEEGIYTTIYLGNRSAKPITNAVTLDRLENGVYVRAMQGHYYPTITNLTVA